MIASRLRSLSSSGGNCEWWKGRINGFVLWQAVGPVQAKYPWEAVLETAAEGEVVATTRERSAIRGYDAAARGHPPRAREALAAAGIDRLWSHQADALESARRGHTIVTTGTASGKSLAFNLPVLDTLASDPAARAFYLYPTKALAQDQARKLSRARRALPAPRDLRRRHAA